MNFLLKFFKIFKSSFIRIASQTKREILTRESIIFLQWYLKFKTRNIISCALSKCKPISDED